MVSEAELPDGANNNQLFRIRFRVDSAKTNYGYVDAITIEDGRFCCDELEADFNCNQVVDMDDFFYMSMVWLTDNTTADIAQPADGVVNLLDLSILAQEWLR